MTTDKLLNFYILSGQQKIIDKKDFGRYLSNEIEKDMLPIKDMRTNTYTGLVVKVMTKKFNKEPKGIHFLVLDSDRDENEKRFKFLIANLKQFPMHKVNLNLKLKKDKIYNSRVFVINNNLICFNEAQNLLLIKF
jgi:hypothetical protein